MPPVEKLLRAEHSEQEEAQREEAALQKRRERAALKEGQATARLFTTRWPRCSGTARPAAAGS